MPAGHSLDEPDGHLGAILVDSEDLAVLEPDKHADVRPAPRGDAAGSRPRSSCGNIRSFTHHLALGDLAELGTRVDELGGDARVAPLVAEADAERLVGCDLEHGDRVPEEQFEPQAVPPGCRWHRSVTFDQTTIVRSTAFEPLPHGNLLAKGQLDATPSFVKDD